MRYWLLIFKIARFLLVASVWCYPPPALVLTTAVVGKPQDILIQYASRAAA